MDRSSSKVIIVLIVILSFLSASTMALAGCSPSPSTSTIPPEMLNRPDDWPMANCAYDNTRATTASGINSNNISTLGLAWSVDITGISEWGGMASNPLISNGRVYCQDLKSNVYAIDLNSGKTVWKKEYNLDSFGPNGPAIGWGKLFVTKGHYEVAALNLSDGKELWSKKLTTTETSGNRYSTDGR